MRAPPKRCAPDSRRRRQRRAHARTSSFAHGEDGVLDAFEAARKPGPRSSSDRCVRDDLKIVAQRGIDLPWTLALNQFDETRDAPPRLYTFPLTVESDARMIARRMRDDAAQNVADRRRRDRR